MAETDSPLKRLVSTFIADFATWLLQANVRQARPLNVELTATTVSADLVFHITLDSGKVLVLHIEFQGRRSRSPMSWRMLEYMTRLASTHRLPLHSVVLYVGRGAGTEDTGEHLVEGANDAAVLSWQYQVVRLWQMPAQELLALGSPAVLALIGQTRIEAPEVVLPAVLTRLRSVPDVETRGRLLTAFLALIEEEEMVEMVERLLDSDDLLLDTPYLRRIRAEGREEGREEGALAMRRRDILQALSLRFGIQDMTHHPIVESLQQIAEEARLETLFAAAIQSADMAAFQTALDNARSS